MLANDYRSDHAKSIYLKPNDYRSDHADYRSDHAKSIYLKHFFEEEYRFQALERHFHPSSGIRKDCGPMLEARVFVQNEPSREGRYFAATTRRCDLTLFTPLTVRACLTARSTSSFERATPMMTR